MLLAHAHAYRAYHGLFPLGSGEWGELMATSRTEHWTSRTDVCCVKSTTASSHFSPTTSSWDSSGSHLIAAPHYDRKRTMTSVQYADAQTIGVRRGRWRSASGGPEPLESPTSKVFRLRFVYGFCLISGNLKIMGAWVPKLPEDASMGYWMMISASNLS